MKAKDSEEFKAAMKKEVNDLCEADIFEVILLKNKLKEHKLIRFIWNFRRKRSPVGLLIKYKARLCVHRGM